MGYLDGATTVPEPEHKRREKNLELAFDEAAEERPGFFEANRIIDIYEQTDLESERKQACKVILAKCYSEPRALENIYDQFEVLKQFKKTEDGREVDARLIEDIKQDIERYRGEIVTKEQFKPTVDVYSRWLELYVNSEAYRQRVSELMRSSFEGAKGILPHMENLHRLAHGALRNADEASILTAIKILTYRTSALPPERKFIDRYTASIISPNDEVFKRGIDVDTFVHFFGARFDPESMRQLEETHTAFVREVIPGGRPDMSSLYVQYAALAKGDTPEGEKVRKLVRFHDSLNIDRGLSEFRDFEPVYPFNLFTRDEHMTDMRRLLNRHLAQRLAVETGERVLVLYHPGSGEAANKFPPEADVGETVRRWFREAGPETTTADCATETLSFMFPPIQDNKRGEIVQRLFQLKGDLRSHLRYLVNPRGDKLIIEDRLLNEAGIQTMTFRPRSSFLDLEVDIEAGNVVCRCALDSYYTLHNASTGRPLNISTDASLVVSELVLSQLHELLCGERAGRFRAGGEGKGKEVKQVTRRPHVRKLPSGRGFTQEQYAFARSEYGIDLIRFNADLGLGKKDGQYTFVRETVFDVEEGRREPVTTRIAGASQLGEFVKE